MSIVSLTARQESDARIAAQKTRLRIQALSHAYALTTSENALSGVSFAAMVEAVVGAYRPPEGRLLLEGEALALPVRLMTPLGLILNELATNAVKYGAWARRDGTLSLHWAFQSGTFLEIVWIEAAVAAPQEDRSGFGTQMITLSLQQAEGEIERSWSDGELRIKLRFPVTTEEIGASLPHGAGNAGARNTGARARGTQA